MRNETTILMSVFAAVILATSPTSAQSVFKANLDQAQAGNTGSTATGFAVLCLNTAQTQLSMTITFNGLTTAQLTGFHIHAAPVNQSGGVVFGLVSPGHTPNDLVVQTNEYQCTWDPADTGSSLASQLANLNASGLYFNAHTAAFPGGEIRGQIVPVLLGDINLDGQKNLLDVLPFINLINNNAYQVEADLNKDGVVNLLDVQQFVLAIQNC